MTRQHLITAAAPKIRLRDLRYHILTGFIFGAFNGLCAFGPDFLKSLGSGGLVALTSTGPVVPYWVEALIVLGLGVPTFGLMGALIAIPVGYYQLRQLYDEDLPGRGPGEPPQSPLPDQAADRDYPDRLPAPAPRSRLPRY